LGFPHGMSVKFGLRSFMVSAHFATQSLHVAHQRQ